MLIRITDDPQDQQEQQSNEEVACIVEMTK